MHCIIADLFGWGENLKSAIIHCRKYVFRGSLQIPKKEMRFQVNLKSYAFGRIMKNSERKPNFLSIPFFKKKKKQNYFKNNKIQKPL